MSGGWKNDEIRFEFISTHARKQTQTERSTKNVINSPQTKIVWQDSCNMKTCEVVVQKAINTELIILTRRHFSAQHFRL
jgi:hypothetical protein